MSPPVIGNRRTSFPTRPNQIENFLQQRFHGCFRTKVIDGASPAGRHTAKLQLSLASTTMAASARSSTAERGSRAARSLPSRSILKRPSSRVQIAGVRHHRTLAQQSHNDDGSGDSQITSASRPSCRACFATATLTSAPTEMFASTVTPESSPSTRTQPPARFD